MSFDDIVDDFAMNGGPVPDFPVEAVKKSKYSFILYENGRFIKSKVLPPVSVQGDFLTAYLPPNIRRFNILFLLIITDRQ